MLVALISFMNSDEVTTGGIKTSDSYKREQARKSLDFNLNNPEFIKIFKPFLKDILGPKKNRIDNSE